MGNRLTSNTVAELDSIDKFFSSSKFVDSIKTLSDTNQYWAEYLGIAFLQPYGINNKSVCTSDTAIYELNPDIIGQLLVANPDYPYWVCLSTLWIFPQASTGGDNVSTRIEFSNLYSGFSQPFIENNCNQLSVGENYIDTFAFGCDYPFTSQTLFGKTIAGSSIIDSYQKGIFTLNNIMAFSSAAYAVEYLQYLNINTSECSFNTTRDLIPMLNFWTKTNNTTQTAHAADGVFYDNSSVILQLSRKVQKIIVSFASLPTLQTLFGTINSDPLYAQYVQVFNSSDYDQVYSDLQSNLNTYGYAFAKATLTCLDNAQVNVQSYQVELLFNYYQGVSTQFFELLPQETQLEINDKHSLLYGFPRLNEGSLVFIGGPTRGLIGMTLTQINLLASYVYWAFTTISELSDCVENFLATT